MVEATRPAIQGYAAVDAVRRREITGFNPDRMDAWATTLQLPDFKGYFVVQIGKPFIGFGTYLEPKLQPGNASVTGKNAGAYASFATAANEMVQVKIGTSFISIEQARDNLSSEIPGTDFTAVMNHLKAIWNEKTSRVSIEGGTHNARPIVYRNVSLMHYPRLFSEHGNYYSAVRRQDSQRSFLYGIFDLGYFSGGEQGGLQTQSQPVGGVFSKKTSAGV